MTNQLHVSLEFYYSEIDFYYLFDTVKNGTKQSVQLGTGELAYEKEMMAELVICHLERVRV